MSKTPKVSVIIPIYNVKKYLKECLESVINQSLKEIEIICIDDGSTDGSFEILKEYEKKDSRIIVINQENKGAGTARNRGLKIAKGEYLAFLDGDDFFNLDFLEKMYLKAVATDSDIVVSGACSYDTNKNEYESMPWAIVLDYLPKDDVFNPLQMKDTIFNAFQNWNWNKIFKRTFIEENNIKFQELFRTNDLFFTCCALVLAKRITTVKEDLVNYRIGMSVNSQSTNHLYPYDFYYAFMALKTFLQNRNLYTLYEESYKKWLYEGCTYNIDSIKDDKKYNELKCFLAKEFKKNGLDIKKELGRYYQPMPFIKKFFSMINSKDNKHKIITILGIKIKMRRK